MILGLSPWYQLEASTEAHLWCHGFVCARLEPTTRHATPLKGVGNGLRQYGTGCPCWKGGCTFATGGVGRRGNFFTPFFGPSKRPSGKVDCYTTR